MGPCDVSAGPAGTEWVEDLLANSVGRLEPATGAFTEYRVPTPFAVPGGLHMGPDGKMWFPELAAGKIAQLDPVTGRVSEYPIPRGGKAAPNVLSLSDDLVVAADGGIWFTEIGSNAIGRIDVVTHKIDQFRIPTAVAVPINIDNGPGQTLLIGEFGAGKIGQFDERTHQFIEYSLPGGFPAPFDATVGPDGAIWFVAANPSVIGRIDPVTHAIIEYRLHAPASLNADPGAVITAGDSNLWFRLGGSIFPADAVTAHDLARFDPQTHVLTIFKTPGFCDLQVGAAAHQPAGAGDTERWLWGGLFIGQAVLAFDTQAADASSAGVVREKLQTSNQGIVSASARPLPPR